MTWRDYQVVVPVTVHSIDTGNGDPLSSGPLVGVGLRWQGHSRADGRQPDYGFFPAGAFAWYRWDADGGIRCEVQDESGKTSRIEAIELGVPYIFKARVDTQANGRGRYSLKAWRRGEWEPGAWCRQREGVTDLDAGSLLLIAHYSDATFGDVTVTPTSRARRAASRPELLRAHALRPRAGARLPTPRPTLRWKARRGTTRYRVQVSRFNRMRHRNVSDRFVRMNRMRVPAGRVKAGKRYVWRVLAYTGKRRVGPVGVSYLDVHARVKAPRARTSR